MTSLASRIFTPAVWPTARRISIQRGAARRSAVQLYRCPLCKQTTCWCEVGLQSTLRADHSAPGQQLPKQKAGGAPTVLAASRESTKPVVKPAAIRNAVGVGINLPQRAVALAGHTLNKGARETRARRRWASQISTVHGSATGTGSSPVALVRGTFLPEALSC